MKKSIRSGPRRGPGDRPVGLRQTPRTAWIEGEIWRRRRRGRLADRQGSAKVIAIGAGAVLGSIAGAGVANPLKF